MCAIAYATGVDNAQNAPTSGYQYRVAVDSQFGGFYLPSINNKGDVAFAGGRKLDDGRVVSGIYATRGTSIVPIHELEGAPGIPSDTIGNPSINDAGTVAYNGIADNRAGIFAGNGGPLKAIAYGEFSSTTINNRGQISFAGTNADTPTYSVFLASGNKVSRIGEGEIPYLNDNGTIAFYRPVRGNEQIFVAKNGTITPVVKTPLRYPSQRRSAL